MSIYREFWKGVAKTASYALKVTDNCIRFSNFGAAGAVTFTLPPIADVVDGWTAEFFVVVDQNVTITAPAGKLAAFNNAAATSIAFSTVAERIGGGVIITYDSTAGLYFAKVLLGIETQTPVIS